ncbi:hypothetical protein [Streptomyces dysideae]|uniref:Uncharacterized protein n=1 Tax=Streptomyces dysideae TaxID=909626 RepID=A0A124IDU3_9ACTN|nr:hypothetical protein [Streptomyces dysideae]KUO16237.1 hypothetical protein AQJ91_37090 [Streptomyces dysideae]
MPMDVYAAVGALVRAEIARTHTPTICPPAQKASAPDEPVAPKPTTVAASPVPTRRRLRARAAAVLRRRTAICG